MEEFILKILSKILLNGVIRNIQDNIKNGSPNHNQKKLNKKITKNNDDIKDTNRKADEYITKLETAKKHAQDTISDTQKYMSKKLNQARQHKSNKKIYDAEKANLVKKIAEDPKK